VNNEPLSSLEREKQFSKTQPIDYGKTRYQRYHAHETGESSKQEK
jgi:hypothetical protein